MKTDSIKSKGVNIIYQIVALMFAFILINKIVVHIKYEGRGWSTYFPSILFLIVFTIKMRATWFLGFLYSLYGLYYYVFIASQISYPSNTEFTLPIVELFFGDRTGFSTANAMVTYILIFPFFFYLTYSLSYVIAIIVNLIRLLSKRKTSLLESELIDQ